VLDMSVAGSSAQQAQEALAQHLDRLTEMALRFDDRRERRRRVE